MESKNVYFVLLVIIVFSSMFILSGCSKRQMDKPVPPMSYLMSLHVVYEGGVIYDDSYEVQVLFCQYNQSINRTSYGSLAKYALLNFKVYDEDKQCYWQTNIGWKTGVSADCKMNDCLFFGYDLLSESVRLVTYVPSLNATFLSNEIKFEKDKKYVMNLTLTGDAVITTI